MLSPRSSPQPPSALYWLQAILEPHQQPEQRSGQQPKIAPCDVAIRVPRSQDTVPEFRDSFNAISQYYCGSISGVGPRLYGVLLFPAKLLPRGRKGAGGADDFDDDFDDDDPGKMATIFLVQRMNGGPLFDVLPNDLPTRRDLVNDLFERMSSVSAFLFDSKEMNVMIHTQKAGFTKGALGAKSAKPQLFIVDFDPNWSGFLWNLPERVDTFAVNALIYGINTMCNVNWNCARGRGIDNYRSDRMESAHAWWTQAAHRMRHTNYNKCKILQTPWVGHGFCIYEDTGLPKRTGNEPPGLEECAHFLQLFVVDRASITPINQFMSDLTYFSKHSSLERRGAAVKAHCGRFLEFNSRATRYFLRQPAPNTNTGTVLFKYCQMLMGSEYLKPVTWLDDEANPPTCTQAELDLAVESGRQSVIKDVLGHLNNTKKNRPSRAWGW